MATYFNYNSLVDAVAEQYNNILCNTLYGIKTFSDCKRKLSWEVKTYRDGEFVVVESCAYEERIPMKDTFWMRLMGETWETKVRIAQQKAFQLAYELVMQEEKLDYQVNRLDR